MSPETKAEREARMMRAAGSRRSADRDAKAPRVTAARTKPVRTTVDLSPELHRELKGWVRDAAARLDVVEVPLAEVFRVLIRRLVSEDEDLQAKVLQDLHDGMQ